MPRSLGQVGRFHCRRVDEPAAPVVVGVVSADGGVPHPEGVAELVEELRRRLGHGDTLRGMECPPSPPPATNASASTGHPSAGTNRHAVRISGSRANGSISPPRTWGLPGNRKSGFGPAES
ncbi:hypothetical protein [Limnoglobus roseus]|uniref:hypothetical protein n=1 Tax=Limnoglobus roseus TaxID=2598579 RepID=UPI00143DF514|nr:hypothetical protein [Limnoglobus roseus]